MVRRTERKVEGLVEERRETLEGKDTSREDINTTSSKSGSGGKRNEIFERNPLK